MDVQDFASASQFLGSRSEKSLMYKTRLERVSDDEIILLHHSTAIIRYRRNEIELDTQGWWTPTTFSRINKYTPFRISSAGGSTEIWVGRSPLIFQKEMRFYDGMVITTDGVEWSLETAKENWDGPPSCEFHRRPDLMGINHGIYGYGY